MLLIDHLNRELNTLIPKIIFSVIIQAKKVMDSPNVVTCDWRDHHFTGE